MTTYLLCHQAVIARSIAPAVLASGGSDVAISGMAGLRRRCAPRNDGGGKQLHFRSHWHASNQEQ